MSVNTVVEGAPATPVAANAPLLEIERLRVEFGPADAPLAAVKDVTLSVAKGEVLGLIGESGSGKSLTCRSALRLIHQPGRIASGSIRFDGRDVLGLSGSELRAMRAREMGMVFQDPFSSLNPVFRVGEQVAETLRVNLGMSKKAARAETVGLLGNVGIPEPERRYLSYPHELSGGMRQRIMIALATAPKPRLLIADEPTTALDVTTQAQILALLARLRSENGMAVLLVSHDFGVIAQVCDRVAVMYGGHIVETGPVEAMYSAPQHPYTRALLESVPALDAAVRGSERRTAIPGQPPELSEQIAGCVFAPRCRFAQESCKSASMRLEQVGEAHASACPVRPFADGRAGAGGAAATAVRVVPDVAEEAGR
ncbi:MAG TPA: ABC transporter ATP-binding protein [Conexibacter sp.]|jgi:oligopeptide/dipeptide ABC transporter ATP-binding protein